MNIRNKYYHLIIVIISIFIIIIIIITLLLLLSLFSLLLLILLFPFNDDVLKMKLELLGMIRRLKKMNWKVERHFCELKNI